MKYSLDTYKLYQSDDRFSYITRPPEKTLNTALFWLITQARCIGVKLRSI